MDQISLVIPVMVGTTAEARDFVWMVPGHPDTPPASPACGSSSASRMRRHRPERSSRHPASQDAPPQHNQMPSGTV
jgi:hypothetical protein